MPQISFVETAAGGHRLGDAQQVCPSRGSAGRGLARERADQRCLDTTGEAVDSGLHGATLSFLVMATSNAVRGVQAVRQLSALRPAARTAWTLARRPEARDALSSLMTLTSTRPDARHPLAPAAVRVERSRLRGAAGDADQTAFTVWFGSGPALPSFGAGGKATRAVLRTAVGVLGAAALGALTVVAANREAARLEAPAAPPRLGD